MGRRVGVRGGFENLPIPSLNPALEPEEEYVQFYPPHFMSDSGRPFTSDVINPASLSSSEPILRIKAVMN